MRLLTSRSGVRASLGAYLERHRSAQPKLCARPQSTRADMKAHLQARILHVPRPTFRSSPAAAIRMQFHLRRPLPRQRRARKHGKTPSTPDEQRTASKSAGAAMGPKTRDSTRNGSLRCQALRACDLCSGLKDTLAERLRRRPAKPMGFPRVGSNPTGVVLRL